MQNIDFWRKRCRKKLENNWSIVHVCAGYQIADTEFENILGSKHVSIYLLLLLQVPPLLFKVSHATMTLAEPIMGHGGKHNT